jgi:DNA-binding NarL/FixJ family response regulator
MSKIRVFIADDHPVLRVGLRTLVESQSDMVVVGEAGDFPQTLAQVISLRPDVVTLDISMPGGAGLAGIETIRQSVPESRILVLTIHDDPAHLRTALAMGATGYLVKSAADSELIGAIRAVHNGRTFVDAQSGTTIVAPPSTAAASTAHKSALDQLSDREREVLQFIAQGHTNQAVADQLDLSVKTVESYRARLMEKLGMKTRADLTRFAIETGLMQSGPSDAPR